MIYPSILPDASTEPPKGLAMPNLKRVTIVCRVIVCWVLVIRSVCFFGGSVASADELTFERHIRPLFRAHCYDCHGSVEELKGGLDLRLRRLALKGGESGSAIAPGDPDGSLLLQRIRSGEMPPGEAKVSAEEIAVLEKWIAAGAKTARPEPESLGKGLGVTPEEREY